MKHRMNLWLEPGDVLGFHADSCHAHGAKTDGFIGDMHVLEVLGKTEDNRKIFMKSLKNETAYGAEAPNGVIFIKGGCEGLNRSELQKSVSESNKFEVIESPDPDKCHDRHDFGDVDEPESLASAISNCYAHMNDPDRGKPKISDTGSTVANALCFGGFSCMIGCAIWMFLIAGGISTGFEKAFIGFVAGGAFFWIVATVNNEMYGKGKW